MAWFQIVSDPHFSGICHGDFCTWIWHPNDNSFQLIKVILLSHNWESWNIVVTHTRSDYIYPGIQTFEGSQLGILGNVTSWVPSPRDWLSCCLMQQFLLVHGRWNNNPANELEPWLPSEVMVHPELKWTRCQASNDGNGRCHQLLVSQAEFAQFRSQCKTDVGQHHVFSWPFFLGRVLLWSLIRGLQHTKNKLAVRAGAEVSGFNFISFPYCLKLRLGTKHGLPEWVVIAGINLVLDGLQINKPHLDQSLLRLLELQLIKPAVWCTVTKERSVAMGCPLTYAMALLMI